MRIFLFNIVERQKARRKYEIEMSKISMLIKIDFIGPLKMKGSKRKYLFEQNNNEEKVINIPISHHHRIIDNSSLSQMKITSNQNIERKILSQKFQRKTRNSIHERDIKFKMVYLKKLKREFNVELIGNFRMKQKNQKQLSKIKEFLIFIEKLANFQKQDGEAYKFMTNLMRKQISEIFQSINQIYPLNPSLLGNSGCYIINSGELKQKGKSSLWNRVRIKFRKGLLTRKKFEKLEKENLLLQEKYEKRKKERIEKKLSKNYFNRSLTVLKMAPIVQSAFKFNLKPPSKKKFSNKFKLKKRLNNTKLRTPSPSPSKSFSTTALNLLVNKKKASSDSLETNLLENSMGSLEEEIGEEGNLEANQDEEYSDLICGMTHSDSKSHEEINKASSESKTETHSSEMKQKRKEKEKDKSKGRKSGKTLNKHSIEWVSDRNSSSRLGKPPLKPTSHHRKSTNKNLKTHSLRRIRVNVNYHDNTSSPSHYQEITPTNNTPSNYKQSDSSANLQTACKSPINFDSDQISNTNQNSIFPTSPITIHAQMSNTSMDFVSRNKDFAKKHFFQSSRGSFANSCCPNKKVHFPLPSLNINGATLARSESEGNRKFSSTANSFHLIDSSNDNNHHNSLEGLSEIENIFNQEEIEELKMNQSNSILMDYRQQKDSYKDPSGRKNYENYNTDKHNCYVENRNLYTKIKRGRLDLNDYQDLLKDSQNQPSRYQSANERQKQKEKVTKAKKLFFKKQPSSLMKLIEFVDKNIVNDIGRRNKKLIIEKLISYRSKSQIEKGHKFQEPRIHESHSKKEYSFVKPTPIVSHEEIKNQILSPKIPIKQQNKFIADPEFLLSPVFAKTLPKSLTETQYCETFNQTTGNKFLNFKISQNKKSSQVISRSKSPGQDEANFLKTKLKPKLFGELDNMDSSPHHFATFGSPKDNSRIKFPIHLLSNLLYSKKSYKFKHHKSNSLCQFQPVPPNLHTIKEIQSPKITTKLKLPNHHNSPHGFVTQLKNELKSGCFPSKIWVSTASPKPTKQKLTQEKTSTSIYQSPIQHKTESENKHSKDKNACPISTLRQFCNQTFNQNGSAPLRNKKSYHFNPKTHIL